jgi:outer membrane protein OmpU
MIIMTFKKTLVMSTALCAVSMLAANSVSAAEKPKLKISGYQETYMGFANGTTAGSTSAGTPTYSGGSSEGQFQILQYGEIRFAASGKTDNGMKWGVYFEDVQNDSDTDGKKKSTDEANLWMSGSWGKLEIGGQDGAADKMRVTGTEVDLLGSNILGAFVDNTGGTGMKGGDVDNVTDSGDDTKITYYTPRVSGLQVGISWAPVAGQKGSKSVAEPEGLLEAALSYKGKAGGAKYEITAAYADNGDNDNTNQKGFLVGGSMTMNNITLAAGYSKNENWRKAASDQKSWSVGAAYASGPMEVSIWHVNQELDLDSGATGDEYKQTTISAAYNLGGGLTAAAGIYLFDLDDATAANSNDGTAFIAKINAKF